MANVTVSVPDELKARMDRLEWVNWSAVARKAFEQRAADIELLKDFTKDSTMTEKDALEIGRMINQKVDERWRKDIEARRQGVKNGKDAPSRNAPRR